MRNRNEEIIRLVEDSYNQGGLSFSGAPGSNLNTSSFYYSNQASLYHRPQNQENVANNHDFEDFLNLIGELYMNDPLKLELCLNFWLADTEMGTSINGVYQKPTQKQTSLYKFVRYFLSGDTLISCLYISYVNMLTGLCTGEESAQHCFVLLQNNGHFYDSHSPKISWNHIFYAFERYYDSFRMDLQTNIQQQQALNYNYPGANLAMNQMRQQYPHASYNLNKGITQQELQGLISVTKLVNQIALHSEKARMALCEYQRAVGGDGFISNGQTGMLTSNDTNLPAIMFGLVSCPIPITLKGEILKLLASLSHTPLIAVNMWQLLENSQILPTVSNSASNPSHMHNLYSRNDIKVELEEIESREETYPLLKGFLNLIKNLVTITTVPDNLGLGFRPQNAVHGFQPYLHFLVNNVYLKIFYRSYKNQQEKWQIAIDTLDIFYQIIHKYEINADDFKESLAPQQGSTDQLYQANLFKTPSLNSPGYRLIYDLIHDGPIIRMLFLILNESLNHLLEYNVKNDPLIEKTSLLCLEIISLVIEKQRLFIEQMKISNLNIDNTGIEKIIITINPKSNRADYLMWIIRFILFNSSSNLFNHAYTAINIMYMLSEYSLIHSQFLNLFVRSCLSVTEQFELLHSFVEFIDYDESDDTSKEENLLVTPNIDNIVDDGLNLNDTSIQVPNAITTERTSGSMDVRAASRLKSLKFILFYLRLAEPNIAHLLLGFDIQKPLKNQLFYNPGTKITASKLKDNESVAEYLSIVPRNCLHCIIRILNRVVREPNTLFTMTNTIDTSYEILYILCSNTQFNQQLLNYLRNEYDFIYNHLRKIPISEMVENETVNLTRRSILRENTNLIEDSNLEDSIRRRYYEHDQLGSDSNSTSLYLFYSWVLNLSCLEVQNLISNRMKTHLKKLTQLLINDGQTSSNPTNMPKPRLHESKIFADSNFDSLIYMSGSRNRTQLNETNENFDRTFDNKYASKDSSVESMSSFNKIFSLLSFMNLVEEAPESLNLNYFDQQLIEKVIDTCKYTPDNFNIQLFDMKKIRKILCNEIKDSVVNISRVNLINELKYILRNVYQRNRFQLNYMSKKKFFDALKVLVESMVLLTPSDVFNLNQRYLFLTALIRKLFQTINHESLIVELTYPISNILFTLVANLRQVITQTKKQKMLTDAMSAAGNTVNVYQLNTSNITDIFKKMIDYLLNSSLTNFKVRTHIYAAILNYLMIFDEDLDQDEQSNNKTSALTRMQLATESKHTNEVVENYKIVSNNVNSLLKLICSDSCEGLNITTMMGLSLLSKIVDMDQNSKWIKFISDNGYVACIINTIVNTDNQLLEECFHSQMKQSNNKIFFIFETKISLLLSIAKSYLGCELLIKNGLINVLASSSIFDLRVKFDRNIYGNRNAGYLIQLLHQYYQLFFPVLNLCLTIIDSTGPDNLESKSQISRFVLSHNESFLQILTTKTSDIKMLEELKLVTSLISKLAPFDNLKYENLSSNFSVEYNSVFSRIHKEMLNLICIFFVPEQLKQLRKEIEQHSANNKDNITKTCNSYFAQIASNICSYCTSIMKVGQFNIPLLIFSPKIENHQLNPYSPTLMRLNSKSLQMGILIDFLKFTVDNLEKTFDVEYDLISKNENIGDLIEIEKKQIIGDYKLYETMPENEKQLYLKQQIKSLLKLSRLNIKNYTSIIEKSLLILWRHVEFYLSSYFDGNSKKSLQVFQNDFYSNLDEISNLKKSNESNFHKNETIKEDFVKFRQDLIETLGSNFLRKFSIIEQKIGAEKADSFINILLKRIQRLVHLHVE